MPKIHALPPLLAAFLLLAGCAQQTEVDANKSRLDALEARMVSLEAADANEADKKLIEESDLNAYLRFKLNKDPFDGRINVDIGSEGYQMVQTRHGPVAVSFKGIAALGGGSKLTLSFVNLSSVDWTDVKLSGKYWNFSLGSNNGDDIKLKTEDFEKSITNKLETGKQALVSINLPKMSEKELKSIDFSIEIGGIAYSR